MNAVALEPSQRTAAKIAGSLYVGMMALAIVTEFFARSPLIVRDAAQTARNIAASELRFRMGIVGELAAVAGYLVLLVALYVVFRPIHRSIALLAVICRVVEGAVFAIIAMNDFAALALLSGASYLQAFEATELQVLARFFISLHHYGGMIGTLFYGLGSSVFAWLWLRSRYIPRGLAAWGIFAASLVAIGTVSLMLFPALSRIVNPAYWVPTFIFEITLGIWLLVKGLRV